jgi:hypothetical protein
MLLVAVRGLIEVALPELIQLLSSRPLHPILLRGVKITPLKLAKFLRRRLLNDRLVGA